MRQGRPLLPVAARVEVTASAIRGRGEVVVVPVPALEEGVVRGQPGVPDEEQSTRI